MVDLNVDNVMKKVILELCESPPKDDYLYSWKNWTRQMFKNYSYFKMLESFNESYQEASDEEWFNKKFPKGFFNEEWIYPKPKGKIYLGKIRKTIDLNLKITQVADKYKLKPLGKKMRVCPFHADSQPSLSLSDKKNVFNCFGCHAKGDIIEFIRRLEDGQKTSN